METVHRRPHHDLAPFVDHLGYYEVDGSSRRERSLPTGTMQLLVNLHDDELWTGDSTHDFRGHSTRGAALRGTCAEPAVIDTAQQRAIAVVSFKPGGAFGFFPAPPAATAGQLVDLETLWGRGSAILRERLLAAATPEELLRTLESALAEHIPSPAAPDPAIATAVAALERDVPVADVAERLGLTPKRFIRHFRAQVGLTPKRFARVRRFQRVLASIPHDRPPDWARIAATCGYADQPHLIHDFRVFSGVSPTGYRRRSPAEPNHADL